MINTNKLPEPPNYREQSDLLANSIATFLSTEVEKIHSEYQEILVLNPTNIQENLKTFQDKVTNALENRISELLHDQISTESLIHMHIKFLSPMILKTYSASQLVKLFKGLL